MSQQHVNVAKVIEAWEIIKEAAGTAIGYHKHSGRYHLADKIQWALDTIEEDSK